MLSQAHALIREDTYTHKPILSITLIRLLEIHIKAFTFVSKKKKKKKSTQLITGCCFCWNKRKGLSSHLYV